jgi:outer membrane protein assembly factor BamB
MKIHSISILFFIFICFHPAISQETTKWRGPNQGVYDESGLLTKWPADGPEIIWTFEQLGIGYSSPAFALNNIFLSGMEGSVGYVYCLSEDGKLLWKSSYGSEFDSSYPGSRATPVIDGELLYMLSGTGDLACMNAKNGRIVWNKSLVDEYGGRVL